MAVLLGAIKSRKGKKTVVKTWTGTYKNDSKAKFYEFPSLKEAKLWIFNNDKIYNRPPRMDMYNYHEIIKTKI